MNDFELDAHVVLNYLNYLGLRVAETAREKAVPL